MSKWVPIWCALFVAVMVYLSTLYGTEAWLRDLSRIDRISYVIILFLPAAVAGAAVFLWLDRRR